MDAQRLRAAGDPAETPTFWVKMRRGSHLACSSLRWPSVGSGHASVRLAGGWSVSKLGDSPARGTWAGGQVGLSTAPAAAAAAEEVQARGWSLSKLGYSPSRSSWTGAQVVLSIAPCAAAAIEKFWCRWA